MGRKKQNPIQKVHFTLPQTDSVAFEFPMPTSTNKLFQVQANGKRHFIGRDYANWRAKADAYLSGQMPLRAVPGPVVVTITIRDEGNRDLDNCAKSLLDACVRHGIIEDDDRKIVREIHMGWGEVEGAIIEIRKAYDWLQRRDLKHRSAA